MNHFSKHTYFMDMAIHLNNPDINTSFMHHYMGAVAVMNGKPIAFGKNSNRSYSCDGFLNHCHSCHAEIDVLRKVNKLLLKGNSKYKKQCLL